MQPLLFGISLLIILAAFPATVFADDVEDICATQDNSYGDPCGGDDYEDEEIPENTFETKYANGRMAFLFGEYKVAYKAWLPLAELGYAKAQASLAWMYHTGNGVEKDLEKALEYYRLAAAQGHTIAENNLGVFYEKGIVVPVDEKAAAEWYHKAAEVGYSYAQYNLGMLYMEGRGVKQDVEEAKYWLLIASRQGVKYATEALEKLDNGPPPVVKHEAKPAIAHAPYHSKPVTKGLAWLEKQDPQHYTIQLARSKDMSWILKLASATRLEQPLIQFVSENKGEEWHNLIYGSFPSKEAAEEAAKTLPEPLRKWSPWVRQFSEVHKQMSKKSNETP